PLRAGRRVRRGLVPGRVAARHGAVHDRGGRARASVRAGGDPGSAPGRGARLSRLPARRPNALSGESLLRSLAPRRGPRLRRNTQSLEKEMERHRFATGLSGFLLFVLAAATLVAASAGPAAGPAPVRVDL